MIQPKPETQPDQLLLEIFTGRWRHRMLAYNRRFHRVAAKSGLDAALLRTVYEDHYFTSMDVHTFCRLVLRGNWDPFAVCERRFQVL